MKARLFVRKDINIGDKREMDPSEVKFGNFGSSGTKNIKGVESQQNCIFRTKIKCRK